MITIFRLTLREVLNKKIFLTASLLTVIFLLLYGILLHYAAKGLSALPAGDLQKAILYPELYSLGLYFACFLVNLLAIFICVGSVSSEIDNGTMQAIVPKPIRRSAIILGKYLGFAFTVVVFSLLIFFVLLFMIRFMSGYVPANPVPGAALFVLQPLILLTLTIFGSTFLSTIANGIAVIMLYVIATVGGMVETFGGFLKNQTLINTGIISSLIAPTDAAYRKMVSTMLAGDNNPINALSMTPFGTSSPPSTAMIIYTVLYILFFLGMSIYVFSTRDI